MRLPDFLLPLFWDVDEDIDIEEYWFFVNERLLECGTPEAIAWLFATYTREQIIEVVRTSRGLSLKTAVCWKNYFGLKEEEVACLRKKSLAESNASSWSY